jgi:hypothetical protein
LLFNSQRKILKFLKHRKLLSLLLLGYINTGFDTSDFLVKIIILCIGKIDIKNMQNLGNSSKKYTLKQLIFRKPEHVVIGILF